MEKEKLSEHKERKEFDLDMLKEVLQEKDKFEVKQHGRRKELVILRKDCTIEVLTHKDNCNDRQFRRSMKKLMLK